MFRRYGRQQRDRDSACHRHAGLDAPSCRQKWSERMTDALKHDLAGTAAEDQLLICRLAGDGMWFAEMFEVYDVDGPRKARLLALLLDMCDRATS
ncbi:hypothetical protein [Cupriavidus sp. D39]|uniref:hypothetical protein n=1 Tax=Cupriavidus sp. D39 TaxID=2997877 RepID=UPI00226D66B8|nr:hypothetical protein [Cupriavidus sp. D39]MCY0856405.1 hypothetical protein [Cupriavidus sp. D39]